MFSQFYQVTVIVIVVTLIGIVAIVIVEEGITVSINICLNKFLKTWGSVLGDFHPKKWIVECIKNTFVLLATLCCRSGQV